MPEATTSAWVLLSYESPPEPPELCESLEAAREAGAHLAVIQATRPGSGGTPYRARDLTWLVRFPLPLLFVFEGELRGPWLGIALACDIRACDATSVFDLEGVDAGAARRLEVLRCGGLASPVTAGKALDAGLATVMAAPGGALAEASRLADVIASRGPIAVRLAKEAIWRGLEMPLEQALRFETDLTLLLQTTKDRAEGVRAFLEKRRPNFTGG